MSRMYGRLDSGQMIFYPGDKGPGDEWFVHSVTGASTNSGRDWENAMATIDQAINLSAANDTIYVAPNHAESIAAANGFDLDVGGVQIEGVRRGRQMPTITFITGTGADVKLAGTGVGIRNLRFIGGFDGLTGPIEVSGDSDVSIVDCEYQDVTGQATDVIYATNGSARLLIDGFRCYGSATPGANSAIALDGCDDVEVRNCYLHGDFAVGGIDFRTTASNRVWVHDSLIWTTDTPGVGIVDTITGSTGAIGPNILISQDDDAGTITQAVTGATFRLLGRVETVNTNNQRTAAVDWTASS